VLRNSTTPRDVTLILGTNLEPDFRVCPCSTDEEFRGRNALQILALYRESLHDRIAKVRSRFLQQPTDTGVIAKLTVSPVEVVPRNAALRTSGGVRVAGR